MIRDGIDWQHFPGLTPYNEALARMEMAAAAILAGTAPQAIWLMEHPAQLTAGLAAHPESLPAGIDLPIAPQRRGGGYKYQGPGLRMVYPLLRVTDHAPDISCFVRGLEKWGIAALESFNLPCEFRPGHPGVWVPARHSRAGQTTERICSMGVRVRRGISLQGFAVHVEPDLAHLRAIEGPDLTSMVDLGYPIGFDDLDAALISSFAGAMPGPSPACTRS